MPAALTQAGRLRESCVWRLMNRLAGGVDASMVVTRPDREGPCVTARAVCGREGAAFRTLSGLADMAHLSVVWKVCGGAACRG